MGTCDICHCEGRGWLDGEDAMPGRGFEGVAIVCHCRCHRPRRFVVWGRGAARALLVRRAPDAGDLGHDLARERGHHHVTREDWCVEVQAPLPDLADAVQGDTAVHGYVRLPEEC